MSKGFYEMFPYSPTPWGAWDKHANIYDANDEFIGEFDHGSKSAVALSNRNRAVECVNALDGIEDVEGFMMAVREAAVGKVGWDAVLSFLFTDEEDK